MITHPSNAVFFAALPYVPVSQLSLQTADLYMCCCNMCCIGDNHMILTSYWMYIP